MKNTFLVITFVATVVFAGLYLKEKSRPPQIVEKTVTVERKVEVPKEVIREVPVEKIVEKQVRVPVEVIKEVPAKIPEEYEEGFALRKALLKAPTLDTNDTEILKGVKKVNVVIFLNPKVKQLVDEGQLRTKVELSLRRNGISVSPESDWMLIYGIEGLGITRGDGEETRTLSYTSSLRVKQNVFVPSNGRWFVVNCMIYEKSSYGVIPYDKSGDLLNYASNAIDDFSNKWLEKNGR